MTRPIFNDYDENGFRVNINGNRTSKIADDNLLYNLRSRWPEELEKFNDVTLVNEYDKFSVTDRFGNNDERFLEWMEDVE